MSQKKEKNDKKIFIAIIILLILILAGVIGALIHLYNNKAPASEYEKAVNEITEIDYSEQQEAVNKIVEEGMININYQTSAIFKGKVSESFNVKNSKNNHHPLVFEISDEDGNVIYTSKKIEPGYEINKIELEKALSKGTHKCQIKIGYAEEGNVSSAFPITIQVK